MLPGTISIPKKQQYGDLQFEVIEEKTTIGGAIQNPNVLYSSNSLWINSVNINLWSAKKPTKQFYVDEHVKTVYDPTPVGYIVPQMSYFSGFTLTGESSQDPSEFNVFGSYNKGWHFHTGLNKEGSSIFFPSLGYRSGESISYTYAGLVATNLLYSNGWKSLYIKSNEVRMSNESGFTNGVAKSMRPVKDKRQTN